MQRLVATQEVHYDGIMRRAGEKFDASEEDARLLKGWGKAVDAPGAQQQQPEPPKQRSAAEGRRYRRRDMVAED